MKKELAEIYCKDMGNGNCEMRIRGMVNEVFSMAKSILDNIAEAVAQRMGIPKWCALMTMADTIMDIAEKERHESGGLS